MYLTLPSVTLFQDRGSLYKNMCERKTTQDSSLFISNNNTVIISQSIS